MAEAAAAQRVVAEAAAREVAAVAVAEAVDRRLRSPSVRMHGDTTMNRLDSRFLVLRRFAAATLFTLVAVATLTVSVVDANAAATSAKSSAPATFATPQAGVDLLIAALRANDRPALVALLGSKHARIVDSGDPVQDAAVWKKFVADYEAKHSVQIEGDSKATLVVGNDEWPTPIPLIKKAGAWQFDASAGMDEILARRIGHNELNTIQVCLAFIDMQRDYAADDRNNDGVAEYAQRFFSSPGKHDGLYWPTKEGEPPSPGGAGLAEASAQGAGKGVPTPYHGYYYRLLKAQGKNAPGGERSYMVNGRLIGGVGVVAYPAGYLASGVMTFMCNQDGTVYQKDLGPKTAEIAKQITKYDPDKSWSKAN
jgi:hypothetical protein